MPRKNGRVEYVQHETFDAQAAGANHVMGPYAINGVDAMAVGAEFTSGTGSGLVTLQRSFQPLSTQDEDIQWVNVGSGLSANGEIQSGKQVATMARVIIGLSSGGIQVHFVANSRNL